MLAFSILLIGCCNNENMGSSCGTRNIDETIIVEEDVNVVGHVTHGTMVDAFPKDNQVHYKTNKHNVAPEMQEILDQQIYWMKRNPVNRSK